MVITLTDSRAYGASFFLDKDVVALYKWVYPHSNEPQATLNSIAVWPVSCIPNFLLVASITIHELLYGFQPFKHLTDEEAAALRRLGRERAFYDYIEDLIADHPERQVLSRIYETWYAEGLWGLVIFGFDDLEPKPELPNIIREALLEAVK